MGQCINALRIFGAAAVFSILILISAPRAQAAPGDFYFTAPAGTLKTQIDKKNKLVVLPNGRLLSPWGKQLMLPPHPYGLAISRDGKTAATLQTTNKPYFLCIINGLDTKKPSVDQVRSDKVSLTSAFMGLAFSNDGKTLYISTGDNGGIATLDVENMAFADDLTVSLNGTFADGTFADAYTGDIVLSPDGRTLYAIDQMNYRVAAVDAETLTVTANYRVGRNPFGLALSPDGGRLYVVNSGMFEYSLVEGYESGRAKETGLTFPPFGFPSDEARDGTTVNGVRVRGLGDPNMPESFSLWALDLSAQGGGAPIYRVKTGPRVGEEVNGYKAVGGSGPTAVTATEDQVFVANEHTDTIAVFDAATGEMKKSISLIPTPDLGALKGVMPFGLALSPDGKRLYVAEAGINAVAAIDVPGLKVLGHFPAGWFPSMVRVTGDGTRLLVTSAKGLGSGPNGGPKFIIGMEGTYVGRLMKGTLNMVPLPLDDHLKEGTDLVLKNNGFVPIAEDRPLAPVSRTFGHPSEQIKHVVFITKENRTFDEVLGDMTYENGQAVDGIPDMARFGMDVSPGSGADGKPVEHAAVTPNHHALAAKYAMSDNFYMDSDVSMDGHRWLVGAYPNEWAETSTNAAYSGNRSLRLESSAPGRLVGGACGLEPEDYLEAGAIWEHLARNGVPFRNWGEGFELSGAQEPGDAVPTGAFFGSNIPLSMPLFENTSREYPTFNMNIPDKFRADRFIAEFQKRYVDGGEEAPAFINIYLPNDHTAGEKDDAGYPFRASYVADNDLALGRIVEFLSNTKYWKDTVVFITEDDPQGGVDHVDAHRSLFLAAGPYVKRGYVSHNHASIVSIIKTINLIFGTPPLNQYDAVAADLTDFFTAEPDFTPYKRLEPDKRIFNPETIKPDRSIFEYSEPLDDPETIEKEHWKRIQDGATQE